MYDSQEKMEMSRGTNDSGPEVEIHEDDRSGVRVNKQVDGLGYVSTKLYAPPRLVSHQARGKTASLN